MKRAVRNGRLTLASVFLLTSCGENRLQSYVVTTMAIIRLLRWYCKEVCSVRRHCSKSGEHMTVVDAADNTSTQHLSASIEALDEWSQSAPQRNDFTLRPSSCNPRDLKGLEPQLHNTELRTLSGRHLRGSSTVNGQRLSNNSILRAVQCDSRLT